MIREFISQLRKSSFCSRAYGGFHINQPVFKAGTTQGRSKGMQLRVMNHPDDPSIVSVSLVLDDGQRVMGSHKEGEIFENRLRGLLKNNWAEIVVQSMYFLPRPVPPFRRWKRVAETPAHPYARLIYTHLRRRFPEHFSANPSDLSDDEALSALISFFNSRRFADA